MGSVAGPLVDVMIAAEGVVAAAVVVMIGVDVVVVVVVNGATVAGSSLVPAVVVGGAVADAEADGAGGEAGVIDVDADALGVA